MMILPARLLGRSCAKMDSTEFWGTEPTLSVSECGEESLVLSWIERFKVYASECGTSSMSCSIKELSFNTNSYSVSGEKSL